MSLHQAACYYQSEYGVALSIDQIMCGVNDMLEQYYRYDENDRKTFIGHKGYLGSLQRTSLCVGTRLDHEQII